MLLYESQVKTSGPLYVKCSKNSKKYFHTNLLNFCLCCFSHPLYPPKQCQRKVRKKKTNNKKERIFHLSLFEVLYFVLLIMFLDAYCCLCVCVCYYNFIWWNFIPIFFFLQFFCSFFLVFFILP